MDKIQSSEIIRITELVEDLAGRFWQDFSSDDSADPIFSRWSAADVLHHLTTWVAYSRERLTAILENAPVRDIDDLETFNRDAWEKGRVIPRRDLPQRLADELGRYRDTVTRFSTDDFDRTDLPTGFDWPLWKYILLDTAVHPGWHFVYHGITRGHYEFAVAALDALAPAMLTFSGGEGSIFDLSELADDPAGLAEACTSFAAVYPENPRVQVVARKNRE